MKLRNKRKLDPNPKVFLDRYREQMSRMKTGNVLYVTYYGARTRIQRTGTGEFDYAIETWKGGNAKLNH